jgi:cysteine synthase B
MTPLHDSSLYPSLEASVGQTPLVALRRIAGPAQSARGNVILGKLEGNNPAGSVKDRPAVSMIARAEARGEIRPGDTLIEATSGNTGIALAMAAAMRGYRMVLIMPENLSLERRQTMKAFGAELILVTQKEGMEGARDLADQMQAEGKGRLLNQFSNDDNWIAHYEGTGPEIWAQTQGRVTHFVSAMGTTGTITGVSRYLKERNPAIQIVGAQPADGSSIPGIRKWSPDYIPPIRAKALIDRIEEVTQAEAEEMARRLASTEGLFCGPSAAGACLIALRVAQDLENATVVFVVCDRGDRYLSTGIFPG